MMWDSLLDYGRLEWQQTLQDLEKAPDITYLDVPKKLDSVWCVKGLIVTRSDLMVTWKVRPDGHYFYKLLQFVTPKKIKIN